MRDKEIQMVDLKGQYRKIQAEVDAAGVVINKLISDAGPIVSPIDVGQGP